MTKKSRDRRKALRILNNPNNKPVGLLDAIFLDDFEYVEFGEERIKLPITWMKPHENKSGYYDGEKFNSLRFDEYGAL